VSSSRPQRRAAWIELDENKSLWAEEPAPINPPLDQNLKVNVVVIGAGYTGLSCAYHIKTLLPDREVVVLEAKQAGHGASGRNGGMCLNQPSIDYMSMIHPSSHKLTYEATARSIRELADLMRAEGYGSSIRFSGSLLTNIGKNGAQRSREYATKAASLGMPIEYWDGDRVKSEIGTGVYSAGLFDPNAAEANPMKIVRTLKKAAEKSGVVVYENSPVLSIDEGKTTCVLAKGKEGQLHNVSAEALVLGTDAYSSRLGYFRSSLAVTHTELAATRRLDDSAFRELGWNRRIPFHDDRKLLYHLGSTEDGRIMIGAGNVEYFFNDGQLYRKNLSRRAMVLRTELVRIYPALAGVQFEYVWSGPLTFSLNMSQSVGAIGRDSNIFYGMGYAGHGVTLAFLFGKVIADLYAGKRDGWKAMPFYQNPMPAFLPPEPLRYLMIKSYIGYLRLADKRK
jgi:gamma-glutamylputrescine oxidase